MLQLHQISKTFYKGTINEKQALKNLDLKVEPGDFITIIGSNGAGKSTLFHAIGGSFFVDDGALVLDGKNITAMAEYKRSFDIGRLMQDPMKGTAPSMTVEENLALAYTRKSKKSFFAINKGDTKVFRDLLARLELGLEDRMKTTVKTLSGGQRQAVTLLMCTIASPKLLLLDEHTAALDPATAVKIMEITQEVVAQANITTMMITHDIRSALSVGNRTIMMDDGEIILDIRGEERATMSVDKLLTYYSAKKHRALADDRILLV